MNKEKLIDYLYDIGFEFDEMMGMVSDCNSYNGSLENYSFFENDEDFFTTFFGNDLLELVRAATYGEYNFKDEYVTFNAYANLESYSYLEVKQELMNGLYEILEAYIEVYAEDYGSVDLIAIVHDDDDLTEQEKDAMIEALENL